MLKSQAPRCVAVSRLRGGFVSQGGEYGHHDTSDHHRDSARGWWRGLVRSRTLVLASRSAPVCTTMKALFLALSLGFALAGTGLVLIRQSAPAVATCIEQRC
jgi:hypothetical protein